MILQAIRDKHYFARIMSTTNQIRQYQLISAAGIKREYITGIAAHICLSTGVLQANTDIKKNGQINGITGHLLKT